jgi:hypothetical protein
VEFWFRFAKPKRLDFTIFSKPRTNYWGAYLRAGHGKWVMALMRRQQFPSMQDIASPDIFQPSFD